MKYEEIKDRWANSEVWTAGITLTNYQKKQTILRGIAVDWQRDIYEDPAGISWAESCEIMGWFEHKAKQYGLIREFRENGIC